MRFKKSYSVEQMNLYVSVCASHHKRGCAFAFVSHTVLDMHKSTILGLTVAVHHDTLTRYLEPCKL